MPTSVVKVNDMEVSTEGSDKTVINITVSQESWLAFLVRSMLQGRAKPWAPASQGLAKGCYRGEQKVLGACQVLLGIVCGAIGVMLCFAPHTQELWSGSPFWTGALLIISGVFCIVSEKRGTGCCVWLALLLTLASVVSATVAVIIGARDMTWSFTFTEGSYLCDSPSPLPSGSKEFWRQQNCRLEFRRFEVSSPPGAVTTVPQTPPMLQQRDPSLQEPAWSWAVPRPGRQSLKPLPYFQSWAEAVGSEEPLLSSDSILPPDKEKAQVGQDV
ncbi:transmembrane protein 176A-like [Dermochelys coriacea]|uniref:transmembrane protein 176A-like n=1 Tax=Dermochelys coriacea TaxID=27794 RepID=UPI001CA87DD0|nr:transmembrane protein 176A-like [Dermochelys coriacea]